MIQQGVAKRFIDASPNNPYNNETRAVLLRNGLTREIPAMTCVFWLQQDPDTTLQGKDDSVTDEINNRGTLFAGITQEIIAPSEYGMVVRNGRVRALVTDAALITYGCSLKYVTPDGVLGLENAPTNDFDTTATVVALEDGEADDTYLWVWVRQQ